MTTRSAQRGAVGALVIAIMVIVLLGLAATYLLSRIAGSSDEVTQTTRRLATAAEALDAFAGSAQRLPCPADPAADTGVEAQAGPATCTFAATGTLPWRTIGLKREDAYDTWGRKITYRVYTGNRGSLTQAGGASMVNCDTTEGAPGGTTATVGSLGGLCNPGGNIYERNTTPAQFLDNKGLSVDNLGTANNDTVAYVLVSHGATGLGGFTVSGAQLSMPAGDERNNTRETGPFTIKAFSDVDVAATSGVHFDDVLAFRTVEELARRANLAARDWPEFAGAARGIVFDAATVSAAAGAPVTSGGVGQSTLNFTGAQVSGRGTGAALGEISFDTLGGYGGIGVATGGSNLIQSGADEFLRIDFTDGGFTKFGATLNDFGFYGFFLLELVEFRFYIGDTQVAGSPVLGVSCSVDGALASFYVDVGTPFNRVEIVPIPALNFFGPDGITAFLVSEVKACPAADATCRTSLDDPAVVANARCS